MIGNGPWWAWTIMALMWATAIAAVIWADHRDRREWLEYQEWHAQHDALGRMVDSHDHG